MWSTPLGPLLLLLYIKDLNSAFNKAITTHFADDTHLSYASKKLSTIESVMNCELKKLTEWLRSNKLSLNSGKSELVIFRSKTKKELDEITIKTNKSKLSPVPNFNCLVAVLDDFLSWEAYVKNLRKKPVVFCPNYVILFHKKLLFQYVSPCLAHLFYTAP